MRTSDNLHLRKIDNSVIAYMVRYILIYNRQKLFLYDIKYVVIELANNDMILTH